MMVPSPASHLYGFLKLPLKIRQEIYKYLFPYNHSHALGPTCPHEFG